MPPRLPRKRRKGGFLLPHTPLLVLPRPVHSSTAHLDVQSGDLEQWGRVPSPHWPPGAGLGAFSDFSRQPHEGGMYLHHRHRPHFTEDTQRAAKRPAQEQTAARGRGETEPREPGSFLQLRGASYFSPAISLEPGAPRLHCPGPGAGGGEGVPAPLALTVAAWLLPAPHPSNSPPEDELERNEAPAAAWKCRVQQKRALGGTRV